MFINILKTVLEQGRKKATDSEVVVPALLLTRPSKVATLASFNLCSIDCQTGKAPSVNPTKTN